MFGTDGAGGNKGLGIVHHGSSPICPSDECEGVHDIRVAGKVRRVTLLQDLRTDRVWEKPGIIDLGRQHEVFYVPLDSPKTQSPGTMFVSFFWIVRSRTHIGKSIRLLVFGGRTRLLGEGEF